MCSWEGKSLLFVSSKNMGSPWGFKSLYTPSGHFRKLRADLLSGLLMYRGSSLGLIQFILHSVITVDFFIIMLITVQHITSF